MLSHILYTHTHTSTHMCAHIHTHTHRVHLYPPTNPPTYILFLPPASIWGEKIIWPCEIKGVNEKYRFLTAPLQIVKFYFSILLIKQLPFMSLLLASKVWDIYIYIYIFCGILSSPILFVLWILIFFIPSWTF